MWYKLRCSTRISSPEKSRNNTRDKILYLVICVWYHQSAAVTLLAFGAFWSGWWMNGKAFTSFFGLWLLNTQICLLLSDSDVPTFQKGKKIKIQKVKQKVIYLVAKLVKAFLVAENESQQRKDLPQADFLSCTWRIYSVSKNLLNNSEFCWLKIRPIVCFCSDLMHVYTVSVPMHFTIVIWSVDPFVLIH